MQGPHTLVKRSLDHIQQLLHNIAMKVKFLQVFIKGFIIAPYNYGGSSDI